MVTAIALAGLAADALATNEPSLAALFGGRSVGALCVKFGDDLIESAHHLAARQRYRREKTPARHSCADDQRGRARRVRHRPHRHFAGACLDVRRVDFRTGATAPGKFKVHYTLDGSEPTTGSSVCTGRFRVALGTTVRAVVFAQGRPIMRLTERFAADEGLLWSEDKIDKLPAIPAAGALNPATHP